MTEELVREHGIPVSRACRLMFLPRMVGCRRFRTLNVIDDCTREVLAIEIDISLSSKRIIRTLDRNIEDRGKPKAIRADNGPEFTSKDLEFWCWEKEIEIQFILPGKPMQTDTSSGSIACTGKQRSTPACSLSGQVSDY